MDQLEIGDFVRSSLRDNKFSRVHGFYHIERQSEATFLQFHTENSRQEPLEVTGNHLVFVNGVAAPAWTVKVGDKLGESEAVAIKSVQRRGVFSPATNSGTIVVDGILVSTYSTHFSHSPISEQTAIHMALTYQRLLCRWNFDTCKNETYSEFGLSKFNVPLIKLAHKINELGAAVQFISFITALPLLAALYLIEQMILFPAMACCVLVSFYLLSKRSKKATCKTV